MTVMCGVLFMFFVVVAVSGDGDCGCDGDVRDGIETVW